MQGQGQGPKTKALMPKDYTWVILVDKQFVWNKKENNKFDTHAFNSRCFASSVVAIKKFCPCLKSGS